ncbi:MAG TPA: FAD-dependent oxidoreductase, partial [Acidimicrobiia bacterium]|nr:FAD-dependent oxidoreductase [Acidimicrobiia bacterium]
MTPTITVVGGGAIGLATAWRIAQRGPRTVVVDPEPGRGATDVAAGMLAPVTEVHYGEAPLLALNLESARRWPSFVTELEAAAGVPVGYRQEGTLAVAVEDDDRRALDALVQFQRQLGLPVERLG